MAMGRYCITCPQIDLFSIYFAVKQIEINHWFEGCLWQFGETEGYCWKYQIFYVFSYIADVVSAPAGKRPGYRSCG